MVKGEKGADRRTALAVDLGGTWLRVARVDAGGGVHDRRRVATPAAEGPEAVVAAIVALAAPLADRVDRRAGACVAAPGPLDPASGRVHEVPNMPGWQGFPLAERLAERLQLPVRVRNDANLAALGEARFGAGRGFDPLIYLTLSTGVGGGLILDGRMFEGATGLAGELGHVAVQAEGPACKLGHVGCLEAFASGTAIAARAREALARGEASLLSAGSSVLLGAGSPVGRPIDAEAVARAAEAGDVLARSLFETAGHALGRALGGFVNLFDPARIVIGGGLRAAWPLWAPAMERGMRGLVMAADQRHFEIVPAALGDDAGLVGAGAFALEAKEARDAGDAAGGVAGVPPDALDAHAAKERPDPCPP